MAKLAMVNGAVVDLERDGVGAVTEAPPETVSDDEIYPRCEGCGEINYDYVPGTRGRKPRYHEGCKPQTPRRNTATGSRRSAKLEHLREPLLIRYYQMADLAGLVHVAYGMSIREKAEAAVEADLEYARSNDRFRKYLESSLEKTALGAVIAVHAAMLQPIAVGEMARRKSGKPRVPDATPPRSRMRRPGQGQAQAPQTQPQQSAHDSAASSVDAEAVPVPDNNVTPLFDSGMPDAEGDSTIHIPQNSALLDDGMPG